MIKKSYIVEPCAELDLAINEIERRIPCFDGWENPDWDDDCFIYWIHCRIPDLPFVERMLAPFV